MRARAVAGLTLFLFANPAIVLLPVLDRFYEQMTINVAAVPDSCRHESLFRILYKIAVNILPRV
jgi:hypothetical protein